MIELPGYTILEKIHSGEKSQVYRAKKADDLVIIKIFQNEYPSQESVNHLYQEFEILKNMNHPHIVKAIQIERIGNHYAQIFFDIQGESLETILTQKQFSFQKVLEISFMIVSALEEIHKQNIIYRDLKPQNIVYNEVTNELNLIDFGSISVQAYKNSSLSVQNSMEGTLAYISPEQSGRMNRSIDYRSDYYSLGITLYQLVSGALPFLSQDPMELIHAHIAKIPASPFEKGKANFEYSSLIMKLLKKNPEDRYQSIQGIVSDLDYIRINLLEIQKVFFEGKKSDFIAGQKDQNSKFKISEKLYGRENELSILLNSIAETKSIGENKLVFLSGRSGFGKSLLLRELQKNLLSDKGYFLLGKYDSKTIDHPYSGILIALRSLITQILTEAGDSKIKWIKKIESKMDALLDVLLALIPELEFLFDTSRFKKEFIQQDSKIQFHLILQSFLSIFCSKAHPLVLALDDSDFMDVQSKALIESILLNPEIYYLTIILSYNDSNPTSMESLNAVSLRLQKSNLIKIRLEPLSLSNVSQIVSETLRYDLELCAPVSEILYSKTKGNPFFVKELFYNFYEKEHIYFRDGSWHWNLENIQNEKIASNVIELTLGNLNLLKEESIQLLQLLSCFENNFRKEIVLSISGLKENKFEEIIRNLIEQGFLYLLDNQIQFIHDKVKEEIYSLIPIQIRNRHHYKIATLSCKILTEKEINELLLPIVKQYNLGIEFVVDEIEKLHLIRMNLLAGIKAKNSTAYKLSYDFFQSAIFLFNDVILKKESSLCLEVFTEASESAYFNNDFESMNNYIEFVIKNSLKVSDKVKVYEIKIQSLMSRTQLKEALITGLEVLEVLGIHNIPFPPTVEDVEAALAETKLNLSRISIDSLPIMMDETKVDALRIITSMMPAAFTASPLLYPIFACLEMNITLEYGYSALASCAYADYATILSNQNDFTLANYYGNLALQNMVENEYKSRIIFKVAAFTIHCREKISNTLPLFQESILSGKEFGDFDHACFSAYEICQNYFFSGKNLMELEGEIDKYIEFTKQVGNLICTNYNQILKQCIQELIQSENNKIRFGEIPDFYSKAEFYLETGDLISSFFINFYLAQLFFLYNHPTIAINFSKKAETFLAGVSGMVFPSLFYFYDSLILLKCFQQQNEMEKQKILKKVDLNQNHLRMMVNSAPMNFQNKYELVEAEKSRCLEKNWEAQQSYELSIRLAKENLFIQEEAIANELAGEFYIQNNMNKTAYLYLREAHYLYGKWSAECKSKQLEEKYFNLINLKSPEKNQTTTKVQPNTNTSTFAGNFLDLNTVLQTSQMISGEIQLSNLLEKMMKIIFENSGAERGSFLLKENETWLIQAVGDDRSNFIEVLQGIPIQEIEENSKAFISKAIVNYVILKREFVLIHDALNAGIFENDPYIKLIQPRSILCFPISNHGNLIAILYLENNLTTHAFTSERIEFLKILSSQIAVSVENSLLYSTLEEKVAERTSELNSTLKLIKSDLLVSQKIQRKIIPATFININELRIFSRYLPMIEVGGDFFSIKTISTNTTQIFLADATGHGVQGALITMLIKTEYDHLSLSYSNPADLMYQLNNAFIEKYSNLNMFFTCIIVNIDKNRNTIEYSSGGHPDQILLSNLEFNLLKRTGKMIGLLQNCIYKLNTVPFKNEDKLFLFTDGLFEEFNPSKQIYEEERLYEMIQKNRNVPVETCMRNTLQDLIEFVNCPSMDDDITFIGVEL
jgi:predicted ATPase/serine phosphatase RsbU (regulator of sigma subunit)/tRNA A-37 threonylcarbamoyl transferase component Bud32